MKTKINLLICLFSLAILLPTIAQEKEVQKLDNQMSVQYLKRYLRKSQPRLVLNSSIERNLRAKLKTDPVVKNIYEAIKLNAAEIQKEPFLERIQTGRRLLAIPGKCFIVLICLEWYTE